VENTWGWFFYPVCMNYFWFRSFENGIVFRSIDDLITQAVLLNKDKGNMRIFLHYFFSALVLSFYGGEV